MLSDSARIRLSRAREMLAAVDDPQLGVDDVAREVEMSPFHFIRQFHSVFGVTPHQFRTARRLEQARLLLARGEHSVTDVCMELGFSSLGSFSALFARKVGESPSAYQRRMRTLVSMPAGLPAVLFPGCLSLMARLPPAAFSSFREASQPRL
jgi:AraC-like DNA-binding protein